jgi:hypothetical protein
VDLLAILDRVIRRVARRLADEAGASANAEDADLPPDLFAQVQAEAATTWRSPMTATARTVRGSGSDRLRAWCDGFSRNAGVVIPDYDREVLERLCRYGARPAFAHDRLVWTTDGRVSYKRTQGVTSYATRVCSVRPARHARSSAPWLPTPTAR